MMQAMPYTNTGIIAQEGRHNTQCTSGSPSPAKLEAIDEDGSLTSAEFSATPPQSASPTPKPAPPSPPKTPSKE